MGAVEHGVVTVEAGAAIGGEVGEGFTNGAEGGVPINFYIKYVSARDIAIAWLQQYYPAMLQKIRGVDDEKKDKNREQK